MIQAMSVPQFILLVGGVITALLAIGASAATIYGSFKRTKNEENRKADRELIETLKTQNDLLRQEKQDNASSLAQATNDIAELRGELRTLKDVPLRQMAQALTEIAATNHVILQNQDTVFKHLGIQQSSNSKEA